MECRSIQTILGIVDGGNAEKVFEMGVSAATGFGAELVF
jgi:hypothetical protein